MKALQRQYHSHKQPGASPSELAIDPKAGKPVIRAIGYSPQEVEEREIEQVGELSGFVGKHAVTWVNVDGLGDAATLQELGRMFKLHRLALEDVAHAHQRAKVERYDEHMYVVMRMAPPREGEHSEQLSLFLGENFVLTFQERQGDCFDLVRERIRKASGRIRSSGADYLTYALLDSLIDAYFPLLERYDERLTVLEELAIDPSQQKSINWIHATKRELLETRRAVWPLRDAIGMLMREEGFIRPETQIYLRDCQDHAIRILDLVETLREIGSGLMDIHLSTVSNRMNQVMQVLTIIATIFIPLSFLAGVFGMNFEPKDMPPTNMQHGFLFVVGAMFLVAVVMLGYFRSKGWLHFGRRKS